MSLQDPERYLNATSVQDTNTAIHSRADADLRSTQLNASEYTGVVVMRSVDMMRIDLNITRNYDSNTYTQHESTVLL